MKDYIGSIVDLTGDPQINPATLDFGDGEGSHGRNVSIISSISIHHDASFRPHDYDSVELYAREAQGDTARLGPGLPYHYRIDNTGVIFHARPLSTWLNCVGSRENVTTIAICLDGNFQDGVPGVPTQEPTREQFEALGQLLTVLCEQHPEFPATWPDVRPHLDFSSTACPGNHLAPWVLAIQSKANALNIPAVAVYDWPELQPGYEAPVVAPPHADAAVAPTTTTTTTTEPEPSTATTTVPTTTATTTINEEPPMDTTTSTTTETTTETQLPPTPEVVKPGFKTTEFYVTLVALALPAINHYFNSQLSLNDASNFIMALVSVAGSVIAAVTYITGRTSLKLNK